MADAQVETHPLQFLTDGDGEYMNVPIGLIVAHGIEGSCTFGDPLLGEERQRIAEV